MSPSESHRKAGAMDAEQLQKKANAHRGRAAAPIVIAVYEVGAALVVALAELREATDRVAKSQRGWKA